MKITEKTIDISVVHPVDELDSFMFIRELSRAVPAQRVLAVNPRNGDYLIGLREHRVIIDSFVSDDEWIDAAKSFSDQVYAGYSHRPLLQEQDASYDLVLVCEDMGFVDDCDAMFREYYRLLKPSGILLGGLWNISYADNIDCLLRGDGPIRQSKLCGNSAIPLDCLTARLGELGFERADIYGSPGNRDDTDAYTEISIRNAAPVSPRIFNTIIHFVCAYK